MQCDRAIDHDETNPGVHAFKPRGRVASQQVGDHHQRATSASVGASLLLTRGLYLEGALTRGTDHSVDGWAAGIGMTY